VNPQVGFLLWPVQDQGCCRLQPVPYFPSPGDIFLYDHGNKWHHFAYKCVGSGPPTHAAIGYQRADGTTALLELVGPTVRNAKLTLMDVAPGLTCYDGPSMIRRLRCPLHAEQAAHMRCFAEAQEGKDFAFGRILLQGTPLRPRHGLRHCLLGKTCLDRDKWI